MMELQLAIEASDRQAVVQALREVLRRIESHEEHQFRLVGRRKSDAAVVFHVDCSAPRNDYLADGVSLSGLDWNVPARRGSPAVRPAAAPAALHPSGVKPLRERVPVPTQTDPKPGVEVITERGDVLSVSLAMQDGSRRLAVHCTARTAQQGYLKHAVIDIRLPEEVSILSIAQHADDSPDDGVTMHVTGVGTSRFLWIMHGESENTEAREFRVSFEVDRRAPLDVDVKLDLAVSHSRWGIPWTTRADASGVLRMGERNGKSGLERV
jgi:hypothetical protein